MAEFCKECSIELFGKDTRDLANLSDEILGEDKGFLVVCEDCGPTLVDMDGKCLGGCYKPGHGSPAKPEGEIK